MPHAAGHQLELPGGEGRTLGERRTQIGDDHKRRTGRHRLWALADAHQTRRPRGPVGRRGRQADPHPRRIGGSPAFSSTRPIEAGGIARVALRGALDQIAGAGGGLTEAISEATVGRQAQGRFLSSATVELFEHYGFTRCRQVGKHAWFVSRLVDPAPLPARRHTIGPSQRGAT
jgi:hypothetical protein